MILLQFLAAIPVLAATVTTYPINVNIVNTPGGNPLGTNDNPLVTTSTAAQSGSFTVTPGTGAWSGAGTYTVIPGTGIFQNHVSDSVTVTPGTGTFTMSGTVQPGNTANTTPWLTVVPSTNSAFTFTATGSSASINASVIPMQAYAIQVVGTGAVATTWDVRLEGSLDNTNFTQILAHTNTTGDKVILYSGAALSPSLYIRARTAGLVLGTATNIVVTILGTQ